MTPRSPATVRPSALSAAILVGAVAVSWLGVFIHNLADLPGQTLLSPESAYPTLIYVVLVVGWFTPARRVADWALLIWCLLNLVGGAIISVLPLPFLPFHPEQTLKHYSFHVIYGVTQIPLLVVLSRRLRNKDRHCRRRDSDHPTSSNAPSDIAPS